MTIGDTTLFAIECDVSTFYRNKSLRALGRFMIHLNGTRYGVNELDATMLACSYDEVERRIAQRGLHVAPFSLYAAPEIAEGVSRSRYGEVEEQLLVMSPKECDALVASRDLLWAPDGDEAFDDGSHILQFDIDHQVRMIGFKRSSGIVDPATLQDVWIIAADYYRLLAEWREAFDENWSGAGKITQ